MKRLLIFLFVVVFAGCHKGDIGVIDNLNNGKVYVIGHGGEGFSSYRNQYPFNSEGSIVRAIKLDLADGIEVDVQLSRDCQNILYHDNYLDTKTNCSGSVFEADLAQLKQCRYSDGFYSALFIEEYLIDLDRAFSICNEMPDPKPFVFVDLKPNMTQLPIDMIAYKDSFAANLAGVVGNYHPERIHFISADADFLSRIKALIPGSYYHIESDKTEILIEKALQYDFDGIVLARTKSTPEDARNVHAKGLYVTVFEVTTQKDIREALKMNPDFIHTDNIRLTRTIIEDL